MALIFPKTRVNRVQRVNPFADARIAETYEARYTADATTLLRALACDFPSVPRHIGRYASPRTGAKMPSR